MNQALLLAAVLAVAAPVRGQSQSQLVVSSPTVALSATQLTTVQVTASGNSVISYSLSGVPSWVSVLSENSYTSPDTLFLQLSNTNCGTCTATLTLTPGGSNNGSPVTVTVTGPGVLIFTCGQAVSNHFINYPCNQNGTQLSSATLNAVFNLESQTLNNYLAAYSPSTTQAQFYAFAGKELRDELRAQMFTSLLGIVQTAPAQRTADQQAVYNWFNAYMTAKNINVYSYAYNQYLSFLNSPCLYKIDSTLAATYGVTFDSNNCNQYALLFFPAMQPSSEYYLALGNQQYWAGKTIAPSVANSLVTASPLVELALGASVAGASIPALAVFNTFQLIAPFAGRAILLTAEAGSEAAANAAAEVGSGFTAAAGAGGAFTIVAIGLDILIQGAIDFSNIEQVDTGLANFVQQYNNAIASGYQYDLPTGVTSEPDQVLAMWTYVTANGFDIAAPAAPTPALVVYTLGHYEYPALNSSLIDYNGSFNADQSPLIGKVFGNYDWEGRAWQVSLWGTGFFLKTCIQGGPQKNVAGLQLYPCYGPEIVRTLETALPNLDPNEPLTIDGFQKILPLTKVLVARLPNNLFDVQVISSPSGNQLPNCPADPISGVSPLAYQIPNCGSFFTSTAIFLDSPYNISSDGKSFVGYNSPESMAFTKIGIMRSPVFTSDAFTGFLQGTPKSFTFNAISPDDSLSNDFMQFTFGSCPGSNTGSLLPPGFTWVPGPTPGPGGTHWGPAQLIYDGTPSNPGTYNFTVCVADPVGMNLGPGPYASQAFQFTLGSQTGFVSPTQLTVYSGVPFSQKIYAVGNPVPSITVQNLSINDPFHYVNFQDNGNGSATVSGTLPYPFQLLTTLCIPASILGPGTCPTVTAANAVSSASAPFNVFAVTAPTPAVVYDPTPWTAGIPNSRLILTSGYATIPAISAAPPGTFVSSVPVAVTSNTSVRTPLSSASWLSFQDNGNGTATLSGTPPPNLNSIIQIQIEATAQYAVPNVGTYNITVNPTPVFNSPTDLFFHAGQFSTATVTEINSSTVTANPRSLPSGVLISGTTVSGTPAPTTGGLYPIPFTATNSSGTAFENVNLYVLESPTLTTSVPLGVTSFQIHAGAPTTINFSASGFPRATPAPGSPPELSQGMKFTLDAQFPSTYYKFSGTTDPSGKLNGQGTLVFQTPAFNALTGPTVARVTIDANNGIPNDTKIDYMVRIVAPGDVNGDSVVNCTDLSIVKAALGSRAGQANYNILADVNLDGQVTIQDYSFVAAHLPAGSVCH